MAEYRSDSATRCERCGERAPREQLAFSADGHLLCRACSARALVRDIDKERARSGLYRICPTCREPTMLPHDTRTAEHTAGGHIVVRGNLSYRCSKCGHGVTFTSMPMLSLQVAPVALALGYILQELGFDAFVLPAVGVVAIVRLAYEAYKRLRHRPSKEA